MVSEIATANKLAHTAPHSQLLTDFQHPKLRAAHSEVVLYQQAEELFAIDECNRLFANGGCFGASAGAV